MTKENMNSGIILTTSQELQALIQDAVNVAVQQFSLPQKIDPLPLPEYLNVQQTSVFLDLAKPTIYGYVCKRTIPFIKKGKKLYFMRLELEKWLNDGKKAIKEELIKNLKIKK